MQNIDIDTLAQTHHTVSARTRCNWAEINLHIKQTITFGIFAPIASGSVLYIDFYSFSWIESFVGKLLALHFVLVFHFFYLILHRTGLTIRKSTYKKYVTFDRASSFWFNVSMVTRESENGKRTFISLFELRITTKPDENACDSTTIVSGWTEL